MFELIAAGFLLADYAYEWWRHHNDQPPVPPSMTMKMPTSQPGATIPQIYGLCLVRTPYLAWAGSASWVAGSSLAPAVNAQFIYAIDMHLVCGVFPVGGSADFATLRIGDTVLGIFGSPPLWNVDNTVSGPEPANQFIGGTVEVLYGSAAQDPVGNGSQLATKMIANNVPATQIPGHRGVLSIFLCNGTGATPWYVGSQPQPGTYAVECIGRAAGYGNGMIGSYTSLTLGTIQPDMNPADVIYDLLINPIGGLGLSPSVIDLTSIAYAAQVLNAEGDGFAYAFEGTGQKVIDRINVVLKQIDGIIYEDLTRGVIVLKLIRADYAPNTVPGITPENCEEIQNFTFGTSTGLPNDVYVTFTDRKNNYQRGQGRAQNQANASGQSGEVVQISIDMPGINTLTQAMAHASRELQTRSQPLMRCRAIVNRSFLRTHPGDVVTLTWPEANISGVYMRVANVGRGTLENGAITLDLIQDPFYVRRGSLLQQGGNIVLNAGFHF